MHNTTFDLFRAAAPSSAQVLNPVAAVERLGVIMQPQDRDATEAWGMLNPAVVRGRDGQLYLFARVVAQGNYSRIRMARVHFDASGHPAGVERLGFVLEPSAPYERSGLGCGGCEDPRITFLPALDRYVMTYTGYGQQGPRVAIALSADLFQWERLGMASFGEQDGVDFAELDNKDAFFFPDPVIAPDGAVSFACLHRPMTGTECKGERAGCACCPAGQHLGVLCVGRCGAA
jgi:predicted GH43/DUF377 family glycosyl hydrolase